MSPNALAWVALYGWPLVALTVFATRRSTARLAQTTAWMVILPAMFLPPNIDLPFASLGKHRIATLSVAAALALFHRTELISRDKWRHFPAFALAVFAFGAWQTIQTNADPLNFGILRLPALGPRDLAWTIYGFTVDLYLPFTIGQRVFRTERDLRDLLRVLTACVLIYAPLCVVEMRLSPQLCHWVYDYHPHQFIQSVRGSGYRPVVFMSHGLAVAMFLFSGFGAAIALHQVRDATRPSPKARALAAGMLLALGRSLAAFMYGLIFSLSLWTSAKTRARAAAVVAILVVGYPVLRAYGVVPTTDIGDMFGAISADRQSSLMTRFNQEDSLLERAMQRPVFGWGGWGRARIYQWWGERGDAWAGYNDVSITDGAWIIWLGTNGFVGFAATFALLVVPILRVARSWSRLAPSLQVLAGSLAAVIALFMVDLIPNSMYDPLSVVYAGTLFTLPAAGSRLRGAASRSTNPERGLPRSPIASVAPSASRPGEP